MFEEQYQACIRKKEKKMLQSINNRFQFQELIDQGILQFKSFLYFYNFICLYNVPSTVSKIMKNENLKLFLKLKLWIKSQTICLLIFNYIINECVKYLNVNNHTYLKKEDKKIILKIMTAKIR